MANSLFRFVFLCLIFGVMMGCAGRKNAIDQFSDDQKNKIVEKQTYVQAEPDFWAAMYEPTLQDLEAMRSAWINHGDALPESKDLSLIISAVEDDRNHVVLVSLFTSAYENADLKNKSLGWAVHPTPTTIIELDESDTPIRALMPVKNRWARYFMLKYKAETWLSATALVLSNRTNRVDMPRVK